MLFLLCFLFYSMHYLAKKFESYFYIMYLCRNLFIFSTSQVWQEIFISGCWNCFPALWKKKSFLTHWNLDGKLFVVEQS